MIQIIEDSEIEDIVIKDNYIMIMCKKLSSEVIKKLARKQLKVGVFYRNGFVLDTVNGVISKIEKTENLTYDLPIYILQEKMLQGLTDYDMFYDFIKMHIFFKEYFKIALYWDERKDKCIYEKTTPLDKLGGATLNSAFRQIRQINVNSKIFPKIKLLPGMNETLNTFVDEFTVSQFYEE